MDYDRFTRVLHWGIACSVLLQLAWDQRLAGMLVQVVLVIGLLHQIPGLKVNVPQGAFYAFPDVSDYFGKAYGGQTIRNADDLAEYLLAEAHVATVSGAAFGAPECLRLSYAASEADLTEACRRIADALGKLK